MVPVAHDDGDDAGPRTPLLRFMLAAVLPYKLVVMAGGHTDASNKKIKKLDFPPMIVATKKTDGWTGLLCFAL